MKNRREKHQKQQRQQQQHRAIKDEIAWHRLNCRMGKTALLHSICMLCANCYFGSAYTVGKAIDIIKCHGANERVHAAYESVYLSVCVCMSVRVSVSERFPLFFKWP